MLTSILNELESFLVEKNYPIIKKLSDGIAEDEIVRSLKKFDLSISPKLIELYSWKNGVSGLYEEYLTEELSLFGFVGVMFPFQQAMETYINIPIEEDFIKRNFFPVFTTGDNEYLLMDLAKRKPSESVFIYSPSLLILKPMTIYDSIERLFETALVTYENNGYYFSGNTLEIDYEIETKIATELNPKSKFWKE
jgi:hypothetical protein